MKRKSLILGLITVILILLSCSRDHNLFADGLSYSDFENNLKSDMTYDLILEKFGQPSSDIGSGIHIYVYKLVDSTEIWIGYTDEILYARHMDTNKQLLHTLI
jgi:hypothetical protein